MTARERGRLRLAAVLALAALACSGCRLDVHVLLDVGPDGAGAVHVAGALDEAAMARVPELGDQLQVDDLVAAGWEVRGPGRERDGRTWVRASKEFATPEEAGAVVAEVSGPDGPFRDFRVVRRPSLLRDEWRATGTVDLSEGLAAFSDDALRERLGGTNVGVPDDEVAPEGRALADTFTFRLEVSLPGDVVADPPTGRGPVWSPRLGERLDVAATATKWNAAALAWLGAAVAAVVAAAALAVAGARGRRRGHRRC